MFTTSSVLMAALLALLFTWLLPALIGPQHFPFHVRRSLDRLRSVRLADLVQCELGTATITYTSLFPGVGTSTPPTASQANPLEVQTAEVNFLDADTQAVIVHNWGSLITYPQPASWANYLLPLISVICLQQTASGSSFATAFTFGITNTNSITMNKISIGTGSGGTFAVTMKRTLT